MTGESSFSAVPSLCEGEDGASDNVEVFAAIEGEAPADRRRLDELRDRL
jgi:hypothetical protein